MNVFERFMCHGDSDEEAPWTNRRSPRSQPRRKAQGGFAWESPPSCDRRRHMKLSPQRPQNAGRAKGQGKGGSPSQSDLRTPAALKQEARKRGKNHAQQQSDETLPIWEDAESDIGSSFAKDHNGGATVTMIPKQYRLSFSDENTPANANLYHENPDRWEAMKIAMQQAAMREEAARAVLSKTPRSHSFLPAPPSALHEETAWPASGSTTPNSHSYVPAPQLGPSFAIAPQSPRCLTFLPPPPPPQREMSLTPRKAPRCYTIWPVESPRPQGGAKQEVQSSSSMTPRRRPQSQARTQSLSRASSAVPSSLMSRAQLGSPGPSRRIGRMPCSAHVAPRTQSPVAPRRSASRGTLSPTQSFIGGMSQHKAWHGRAALSFQPPPTTDTLPSARSPSNHGVSTPVKIAAYTQALSSPS